MKQIIINSEAPGFRALEKAGSDLDISEVNILHLSTSLHLFPCLLNIALFFSEQQHCLVRLQLYDSIMLSLFLIFMHAYEPRPTESYKHLSNS